MRVSVERLRQLTLSLGIGTLVVGIAPWIAPRWFARTFGISKDGSPAIDVAIRSVSARDAINGIGILSATIHGGRVAPWILARALSDGTDTVAIGIAWTAGARDPRLFALGAIAFGATALDVVLYVAHKTMSRGQLSR